MSGIPNSADARIWRALLADAQRRMPGYRVVAKESSLLMRLLGRISAKFATQYTSTLGLTTFMPAAKIAANDWTVLGHESVHAEDYLRNRAWWFVSYAFPQWLALGALAALGAIAGSLWWLASLAALTALVLPAPFRTHWERRGYLMSMCLDALKYGEASISTPGFITSIAAEFTSGAYLWMDPLPATVEAWVLNDVRHALAIVRDQFEDPDYSPTVRLVRAALQEAA